jgi:hypothetical protein
MGWDWVHLVRRPLTGLLYQPRMTDDECGTVGISRGTEILGENLPHCYFIHHISHVTWPGLEPLLPLWETATNRLSYGTMKTYEEYVATPMLFLWRQHGREADVDGFPCMKQQN